MFLDSISKGTARIMAQNINRIFFTLVNDHNTYLLQQ